MNTPPSENAIKTVLELDLASYSDIARALEENLDVYAVKAFEDQVQSFVDHGLAVVGLNREDVVLGSAGDNAILVLDDAAVMHRFAEAVQQRVAAHNSQRSVESAKRWFRMGAATGPILVLQEERRIVGATVARAVRLEAAAKNGQILVDAATYDLLPDRLKGFYDQEEEIRGKRDERFLARRCTFVPTSEPAKAGRPAKPASWWLAVATVFLVCGALAIYGINNGNEDPTVPNKVNNKKDLPSPIPPAPPVPNPKLAGKDPDRAVAEWAVGIGARVVVVPLGTHDMKEVSSGADLPEGSFRLINVDFRTARIPITDVELANLSDTSVDDLTLTGTKITDAGLDAISKLRLHFLAAEGVRGITDAGAARIGRMLSLRYLDLSRTQISDEGLDHLQQLIQLGELNVRGTEVTREGVQRLKSIHRDRRQKCRIEDDWSGRD